jgi:hypothetical protein
MFVRGEPGSARYSVKPYWVARSVSLCSTNELVRRVIVLFRDRSFEPPPGRFETLVNHILVNISGEVTLGIAFCGQR